jgi:phage N-6-adenine-methyltransferase
MTRQIVSSKKQDWSTPSHLVKHWVAEYQLNTDLCAEAYNTRLPNFISPEQNSLGSLWAAPIRGFCNPPFEDIGTWMKHAMSSCAAGGFSFFLVPANPDTRWFHMYAKHAQVDFFRGRINFVDRTPPEVEIQRLFKCPPNKKNAEKIAHRLYSLYKEGKNMSDFDKEIALCRKTLGDDLDFSDYEEEKPSGASFPTMAVIFDPHAYAQPQYRTRCAKTGKLI